MGKHVRGPLVVGASYARGVYFGNRVVLPGGWMKSHGIGNKDQVMIQTLKDQIVITPIPKKAVPVSKTPKTKKVSIIKRKYRKHLKSPVSMTVSSPLVQSTIPVSTPSTTETKITKAKSKKKGSIGSRSKNHKVSKVTSTVELS